MWSTVRQKRKHASWLTMAQKIGVDHSLLPQDIHRRDARKGDRNRILKLPLNDVHSLTSLFATSARCCLLSYIAKCKPRIASRRDLTHAELQLHDAKKKECFDRKKAAISEFRDVLHRSKAGIFFRLRTASLFLRCRYPLFLSPKRPLRGRINFLECFCSSTLLGSSSSTLKLS